MKIVFDLDKTLIRVNSFPKWVKFLLKKSLDEKKYLLGFELAFLLITRKLGIIDHVKFKSILCLKKYPKKWDEEFAEVLIPFLRTELIDGITEDETVVVATAAPKNYSEPFVKKVFAFYVTCLASEWIDGEFINNFQTVKAERVISHLKANPDIFYTDSVEEDGPLIEKSKNFKLIE